MQYGICLTSFDRVDCALINQEIIHSRFTSCAAISHATASASYEPHLEDAFVRRPPLPLHEGAVDLIRSSFDALDEHEVPYLVHLEADTWIVDEAVIEAKIAEMEREDTVLSTTMWSPPGWHYGPRVWWGRLKVGGAAHAAFARDYSTQFFIIKNTAAARDAIRALDVSRTSAECSLYREIHRRVPRSGVSIMQERSPVVDDNRWITESLALYSQHWPAAGTAQDPRPAGTPGRIPDDAPGKREVLRQFDLGAVGPNAVRLMQADDLSYYNRGAKRY
jgi:hypothetical protein